MSVPLQLLLLEDRAADADLALHALRRAGYAPEWLRVETEAEYLAALDPSLDLILADYSLPQFDALRALELLRARALDIPFIIVSGTIGEEVAVAAIRQGAADYLIKDRLARLGAAVEHALEQRRLRAEMRRADQALRHKTALIQLFQEVAVAANEATTLDQALQTAVDTICTHIGWPVGHVYLPDPAEPSALLPSGIWHLADARRFATFRAITEVVRLAPGIGLPGQALAQRKPAWVADMILDASTPRTQLIKDLGVRASFALPVVLGDDVAAVLEFFATETIAPDTALLEILQHVGTQLGRVVERTRAETALRESEERFRVLFAHSPDAIVLIDPHASSVIWPIVECNDLACKMNGYTREELIGQPIDLLNTTTDTPTGRIAYIERLRREGMLRVEVEHRRKDGSRFPIEVVSSLISVAGRELVLGIDRDISERKRAEEALRAAEAQYRALVEQIPAIIYTARTDEQSSTYYVSPQVESILGFSPEEWLADPHFWLTQVYPDDRTHVLEAVGRIQSSDAPIPIEYRSYTRDGRIVWLQDTAQVVHDDSGQPLFVQGITLDITERKQAEADLDQRVRLAALAADIGVGLTKAHTLAAMLQACAVGLVQHLDAAFARIWTLNERDQVLELQASAGMYTHLDGAHGRIPVGMFKIGQIAQERRPYLTNAVLSDPQIGDPTWARREGLVAFAGYPLIVEDRLAGVIALFARQPLTQLALDALAPIADTIALGIEHKQVEAALIEERALLARRVDERTADLSAANAELARAAMLKDAFLASMSHELRTPLNAVLGLSEALQEETYGPLNDKQRRSLQSIEESGRHLLALINDILDLAKIGAGQLELALEPASIATIGEASLRLIAQLAQQKRLSVSSEIDPAVTLLVVDARRVKQILVNLLSNAVKFTPAGGSIGLEVVGDPARQTVDLTVWDTGIGIASEHRGDLFQPFVQLDSRLARQYEGTGLGLALVYRMVELHGGSITVTSEVGQGSRFTVTLPWNTVGADPHSSGPIVTEAVVGERPRVRRVLIVEDSPTTADHLIRYLQERAISSATLRDGAEVVGLAITMQPDLIFLDLLLPDISGWEVLTQLKTEPRTSAIPVVIVSVVDERARALGLGAADYLVKPITRVEIQRVLTARSPVAPGATIPSTYTSPPPLVLLAEDNEATSSMVADYLGEFGYQVVVARTGAEAIARAQEVSPAIVLMDIQMPGMDGLEAIRRIRASAEVADVPIIALTALAMPGDRERCLAAGANAYLSKPVSLRGLASLIETILNRQ
jgi:PAS domain S-box-containing protein